MLIRTWNPNQNLVVSNGFLQLHGVSEDLSSAGAEPELRRILGDFIAACDLDVAEFGSEGFQISTSGLLQLKSRQLDVFEWLLPPLPLSLQLGIKGAPGQHDTLFTIEAFDRADQVRIEIDGPVATWRGALYWLDASLADSVNVAKSFNTAKAEDKTYDRCLKIIRSLQLSAANNTNLVLKGSLRSQIVIEPSQFSIGVRQQDSTDDTPIFAYPIIAGVDEDKLSQQFLSQMSDVPPIISIPSGSYDTRIVLSGKMRSTLQAFKQSTFGMDGDRKATFLKDPLKVLPESPDIDLDAVDTTGFGDRVIGLGYLPPAQVKGNGFRITWFPSGEPKFKYEATTSENEKVELGIKSSAEAKELLATIGNTDVREVEYGGKSVAVTDDLIRWLTDVAGKERSTVNEPATAYENADAPKQSAIRNIIVHTNEERKDFAMSEPGPSSTEVTTSLEYLLPETTLKSYQVEGIGWLQNLSSRVGRLGGLLADDMGLGKTLQILAFLSWYGGAYRESLSQAEKLKFGPMLVLVPPILLHNWREEILNRFDAKAFMPIEVLDSQELNKRFKRSKGWELKLETPTLDIEELKAQKLIILSYDALKNFQHSFARIDWSIVVADEAQEIKETNSGITHVVKSLKTRFRVASTGTPVENSLSNLWNIIDFVTPGGALGSLREFLKHYQDATDERSARAAELKQRIGFNEPAGLVRRRTKSGALKNELLDKVYVPPIVCGFSEEQLALYKNIVDQVRTKKVKPLGAIGKLSFLTQHPSLVDPSLSSSDPKILLRQSPKLRVLIDKLRAIREMSKSDPEKVLIFTRSIGMQGILQTVIFSELGIDADIINGESSSRKNATKERFERVERFQNSSGFNVLILSPDVAGTGLNITAANHVFHYGRWWNPAKENQATDRAYRIGQKKKVFVYHIIASDKENQYQFDAKLDELIREKLKLAEDFLAPMSLEEEFASQFSSSIFSDPRIIDPNLPISSLFDLDGIPFESWLSCLYKKEGYATILTPVSNDRGVDLIAVRPDRVLLIQAKFRGKLSPAPADGVMDVVRGLDFYRSNILRRLGRNVPVEMVYASTGTAESELIGLARNQEVTLRMFDDLERLRKQHPITLKDLQVEEAHRSRSAEQACLAARKLLERDSDLRD